MSIFAAERPVSFGEKLAASDQFTALFAEGMDLVGAAAAYLDGAGREQAQALPRPSALAYAVESMRLTTRLMQIASWLLLQRAVNEGELTRAEASSENRRIHLSRRDAASTDEVLAALPRRLCELIESSLRLQARIRHLDGLIHRPAGPESGAPAPSPVESQIALLRAAFPAQGC
jgi:regulator of CtrA degradation